MRKIHIFKKSMLNKNEKNRTNIDEKLHVFWDVVFGWIPCAAHRPPHQKGKTKSASKCKSVAIALIKASRNEVPVAAKGLG